MLLTVTFFNKRLLSLGNLDGENSIFRLDWGTKSGVFAIPDSSTPQSNKSKVEDRGLMPKAIPHAPIQVEAFEKCRLKLLPRPTTYSIYRHVLTSPGPKVRRMNL